MQHHGYPTPLLDWTNSPFIAAYFAFRNKRADGEFARIFVLDQREWIKAVPRSNLVTAALPHFSFLNPLAINNPRMVPQQALSTVANIDDIEEFIAFNERNNKKTYLEVIDLPMSERPQIIQELKSYGYCRVCPVSTVPASSLEKRTLIPNGRHLRAGHDSATRIITTMSDFPSEDR